jgi:hypothetical protein
MMKLVRVKDKLKVTVSILRNIHYVPSVDDINLEDDGKRCSSRLNYLLGTIYNEGNVTSSNYSSSFSYVDMPTKKQKKKVNLV